MLPHATGVVSWPFDEKRLCSWSNRSFQLTLNSEWSSIALRSLRLLQCWFKQTGENRKKDIILDLENRVTRECCFASFSHLRAHTHTAGHSPLPKLSLHDQMMLRCSKISPNPFDVMSNTRCGTLISNRQEKTQTLATHHRSLSHSLYGSRRERFADTSRHNPRLNLMSDHCWCAQIVWDNTPRGQVSMRSIKQQLRIQQDKLKMFRTEIHSRFSSPNLKRTRSIIANGEKTNSNLRHDIQLQGCPVSLDRNRVEVLKWSFLETRSKPLHWYHRSHWHLKEYESTAILSKVSVKFTLQKHSQTL
jgi:hypothetical protein